MIQTRKKIVIIGISLCFLVLMLIKFFPLSKEPTTSVPNGHPEITGWVAWWKETQGYDLIDRKFQNITEISPFWFRLNSNYLYDQKGSVQNRTTIMKMLKSHNIKVYPTLSSTMTAKELSVLLNDTSKRDTLCAAIIKDIKSLKADGFDIDLEGIDPDDKESFTNFLQYFKDQLSKNNLKFIITVQAQTGKNDPSIVKGQDLPKIAQIADEVRVMAYDKHGTFSAAGAITPFDWYKNVLSYVKSVVPLEKLVIGVPSYGYIWPKQSPAKGLQYDEFMDYVNNSKSTYTSQRDEDSGEMIYKSDTFVGYVSDAESISQKIKLAQSMGINKFAIWNIGGMDETFFDFKW